MAARQKLISSGAMPSRRANRAAGPIVAQSRAASLHAVVVATASIRGDQNATVAIAEHTVVLFAWHTLYWYVTPPPLRLRSSW